MHLDHRSSVLSPSLQIILATLGEGEVKEEALRYCRERGLWLSADPERNRRLLKGYW